MKNVDFIIVGAGLAGLCFARYCQQNNLSFVIYDNNVRSSSLVAGGMYNPVVLKRFTPIWMAEEQLNIALPFYKSLEQELGEKLLFELPIYRKFASVEEQNNWFVACDKPNLSSYFNNTLHFSKIPNIPSPFGFGEVYETGYLDVAKFLQLYRKHLQSNNCFIQSTFNYSKMTLEEDNVTYEDIKAKNIVFAEGFSLQNNPFFNDFPLDGTKGELLLVRIPDLKLDKIVKSNIFILPFRGDLYKVGATYDWNDKTDVPTEEAKEELINNLRDLITCDFKIVEHLAGVRPTVKDRRPLIGTHYMHKNLHLLNGLGTRGVLLAPFLANELLLSITSQHFIDNEWNINRYYKKQNKI